MNTIFELFKSNNNKIEYKYSMLLSEDINECISEFNKLNTYATLVKWQNKYFPTKRIVFSKVLGKKYYYISEKNGNLIFIIEYYVEGVYVPWIQEKTYLVKSLT